MPRVSAVIPTRNRPGLVCRAVQSVLTQTYTDLEAIVVIDGPDPATLEALSGINDPRLRVIALDKNVGGSEARNIGVESASGEWIAFLDDDDEWLPKKTEIQMRFAAEHGSFNIVIGGRYLDRRVEGDFNEPRATLTPGQPISEFMFCTVPWMGYRGGFLGTCVWMVSRELALTLPFTKGLRYCQDADWLLRAEKEQGAKVVILPDVLAIMYNTSLVERISSVGAWKGRYEWAKSVHHCFTRRAFAYFIATEIVPLVVKSGPRQWVYLPWCFGEMLRMGAVEGKVTWLFLRNALLLPLCRILVPKRLRIAVRNTGNGIKEHQPA